MLSNTCCSLLPHQLALADTKLGYTSAAQITAPLPCSMTGDLHVVKHCGDGRKFQVTENLNQTVLSVKENLKKVSFSLQSSSQGLLSIASPYQRC